MSKLKMDAKRREVQSGTGGESSERGFATESDYSECRRLHRKFGTTYYFASRLFPSTIRRRVDALYGFVRLADEWVDNPSSSILGQQKRLLNDYRSELLRGLDGVRPEQAVLRAFCDVVHECRMPLEEPLLFLDAMEQDLEVARYPTYGHLCGYMRGSAAAVGVMMCAVLGAPMDDATLSGARALGEAMQLTNFLRDIREDWERGRLYLPEEDLASFGVTTQDIAAHRVTPEFVSLMKFEIERARSLYRLAEPAIAHLPPSAQKPVQVASILYSRILGRIEAQGYDVFTSRARTSRGEKLRVGLSVAMGLR